MGAVRARVIAGDSMKVLTGLEEGCAALVLADPPYGIGYRDRWGRTVENDDAPWLWWLREARRVCHPDGALVCFCRWDVQHAFEVAITCAGFRVRSQIVWDKGWGGMGDSSRTVSPRHELAWFATRGRFRFPAGRPESVIRCNRPTRATRTHPCEKPVDLLSRLVLATTRPGDLVVDPFCGSGASGVACVRTGRRFVGVEIDAEHARTARSRIAAARRKERCHAHRKREAVHRRHVRRRAGRVAGDV